MSISLVSNGEAAVKCSPAIRNMNEVLTEDIVKVIFSKLPFSNLSICRIVCKAWNDLVLDYALCSKFHHRKSLLVCTSDVVPDPGPEAFPYCNPKVRSMDFGTNTIDSSVATFKFDGDWNSVSVFCSCNGLLYIAKLTYVDWVDGIWNPMTNEFVQLPGIEGEDRYYYGFGFSPKTKEYKLFRVDYHELGTEIEIWRFGIRNELRLWESIGWLAPQNFVGDGAYLDGVIYWLSKAVLQNESQHVYLIHALDVETESFETSYPSDPGPCTNAEFGIQLVSFNGKLIVIIGPCTMTDFRIQLNSFNGQLRLIITMYKPIWKACVWIMREHSWIREFVFDIPIHEPLKLFFIEASKNEISLQINGDLYVFDKNGKIKTRIKTLLNTNENINDVRYVEAFQFGSLPRILAGDY